MKPELREHLLRAAALIGLGMSALLVAEYRRPSASLCVVGGGCDVARQSQYAVLAGIPLPILGVAFFATILFLAMVPQLRRWLWLASGAGAAVGLALIAVQAFILNAYCPYCLVVDVAAIAVGALAASMRGALPAPPRLLSTSAYAAAALVAVIAPLVWHARVAGTGAVPAIVQREQRTDGLTVVEFVDFECPACRAQHAEFETVLEKYSGRVSVVFKHLPLPQHQNAADAARAFCCAEENGAAREMAGRLFRADSLRREDCEEMAVSLGLDREQFRSCVDSERVATRLRADQSAADDIGIHSLPTFWIGHERFEGVLPSGILTSIIERALQDARKAAPS